MEFAETSEKAGVPVSPEAQGMVEGPETAEVLSVVMAPETAVD